MEGSTRASMTWKNASSKSAPSRSLCPALVTASGSARVAVLHALEGGAEVDGGVRVEQLRHRTHLEGTLERERAVVEGQRRRTSERSREGAEQLLAVAHEIVEGRARAVPLEQRELRQMPLGGLSVAEHVREAVDALDAVREHALERELRRGVQVADDGRAARLERGPDAHRERVDVGLGGGGGYELGRVHLEKAALVEEGARQAERPRSTLDARPEGLLGDRLSRHLLLVGR